MDEKQLNELAKNLKTPEDLNQFDRLHSALRCVATATARIPCFCTALPGPNETADDTLSTVFPAHCGSHDIPVGDCHFQVSSLTTIARLHARRR